MAQRDQTKRTPTVSNLYIATTLILEGCCKFIIIWGRRYVMCHSFCILCRCMGAWVRAGARAVHRPRLVYAGTRPKTSAFPAPIFGQGGGGGCTMPEITPHPLRHCQGTYTALMSRCCGSHFRAQVHDGTIWIVVHPKEHQMSPPNLRGKRHTACSSCSAQQCTVPQPSRKQQSHKMVGSDRLNVPAIDNSSH